MSTALTVAVYVVAAFFAILAATYLVLSAAAAREIAKQRRNSLTKRVGGSLDSPMTPPVSVLLPAFNESAGVVESVTALLRLRYPKFEVIVVNDGSTDDTLDRLVEAYALEPFDRGVPDVLATQHVRNVFVSQEHDNLVVVDKENGGKADALNAGINVSRHPLICSIDADSLLEPDSLLKVAEPMILRPERVIATGGVIRIANGSRFEGGQPIELAVPRRVLPGLQVLEYLRAFLIGRTAWSTINGVLIISGAFGLFRKEAVVRVGGYAPDTVGEDAELVVRMHRRYREEGREYEIVFVPDPVCWTEAPETLSVLRRQRRRWQRGLLDTTLRHAKMIGRPRYGPVGMLALPYFVAFELAAPVVELLSLPLVAVFAATGHVSPLAAAAFFLATIGLGLAMSVAALTVEELTYHRYPRWSHLWRLILLSLVEPFGYRQLNSWWRLEGLWQGLRKRGGWGTMARSGSLGRTDVEVSAATAGYRALRAAVAQTAASLAAVEAPGPRPADPELGPAHDRRTGARDAASLVGVAVIVVAVVRLGRRIARAREWLVGVRALRRSLARR